MVVEFCYNVIVRDYFILPPPPRKIIPDTPLIGSTGRGETRTLPFSLNDAERPTDDDHLFIT